MKKWTRLTDLGKFQSNPGREIWEYRDNGDIIDSFQVDIYIGKWLDVMNLKHNTIDELKYCHEEFRKAALQLFSDENLCELSCCVCCDNDIAETECDASVFGIEYFRCKQCGHAFLRYFPNSETIDHYYTNNVELAEPYTDRKAINVRMSQVIQPKIDWIKLIYKNQYGRLFESVCDVGAGGGHFIAGLRKEGLKAEGYEISKQSIEFANKWFGIELSDTNYLSLEQCNDSFDVITFWGLFEYISNPKEYLVKSLEIMNKYKGMVIIEVPRFDSLSTAVLKSKSSIVTRHLLPNAHRNLFSDDSLASLIYSSGFRPIAAWYFGMDIYEVMSQIACFVNRNDIYPDLVNEYIELQKAIDQGQICDDIVVAAIPIEKS